MTTPNELDPDSVDLEDGLADIDPAGDRPDYKWDQEEVDDLRRQGYERGLADARAAVDAVGRWRSFPDDTLLSRAAVLTAIDALIHDETCHIDRDELAERRLDGEATP